MWRISRLTAASTLTSTRLPRICEKSTASSSMPASYRILMDKQIATDLEAIFDHIAGSSPQSAARVVDRILGAIEGLKVLPHRSIARGQNPKAKYPIRSLVVQSWIVF